MSLWTFTEISERLECSPQNIYQKKAKLKKLGYIETDTDGKEKINDNGYNYLLEQRKNTMQSTSNNLNNTCLNSNESPYNSNETEIKQVNLIVELLQKENENLKKQLEAEKDQTKYWQELYVKQNEDYKKITFPLMIGTEEQNKRQTENVKKSFWSRLFN